MFGPHRRERIACCGKFGGARLGRLKEGLGGSNKNTFPGEKRKMAGANTCLDRTGVSGSRFLQKTAKHGLGAVKQGPSAANQCMLAKKQEKTLPKWMDGSVFGPHRRERIVFLRKFGDARRGRLKKSSGAVKKHIFAEQVQK